MVDEYLVVFPVLEKVAKDFGLKLIMKKNFRQFYDDMCAEEPVSGENILHEGGRKFNRGLFKRMVNDPIQKESSHLKQSDIEQQFDISCLYCVFAFQKEGQYPNRRKTAFRNFELRRPIINIKEF